MTPFRITAITFFLFASAAIAQNGIDSGRDLQIRAARAAELGNYDEARKIYAQELSLLLANGRHAEAGDIYLRLGEINQINGTFPAAEATYKKGLDLLKSSLQPNDLRLVMALDDLGWLYVTWGKFNDGSHLLDQARTRADSADPNDPRLIRHLDTHAAYLMVAGRYSEAQKDWTRALEVGNKNYGPDSPKYDTILVHYGQGSVLRGDYRVAEQMFKRYLAIENYDQSETTTAHAVAAGELARVYTQLHRYPEAQNWFETSTRILNQQPEQAPLIRSMILSYWGDFYMTQGDWSNAQAQYREALGIQEKVLGENRAVASAMISLSSALKKLHFKDEARSLIARAKAIFSAQRNPLEQATVDVLALRHQ